MKQYNHFDMIDNVYEYCKDYFEENGYAPSNREIAKGVGLKSTSSVFYYMQKLFENGTFKTKHPGQPRAFGIVKEYESIEKKH